MFGLRACESFQGHEIEKKADKLDLPEAGREVER